MTDRVLRPEERWLGAHIWFGYVVQWGKLAPWPRSQIEEIIGITHIKLIGGHYFTLELWRVGWYLNWFRAS